MTNNNVNGLPIQLDAPSVNAILKNKKTQTRRVVDELVNRENDVMLISPSLDGGFRVWFKDQQYIDISSPFGNRGDKLWSELPRPKGHGFEDSMPSCLFWHFIGGAS